MAHLSAYDQLRKQQVWTNTWVLASPWGWISPTDELSDCTAVGPPLRMPGLPGSRQAPAPQGSKGLHTNPALNQDTPSRGQLPAGLCPLILLPQGRQQRKPQGCKLQEITSIITVLNCLHMKHPPVNGQTFHRGLVSSCNFLNPKLGQSLGMLNSF